ncbi:2-C-methyl-D-erythritol 4-phosphate cytidylyltransferase [Shewanella avicenniae]|uniref:2-C-methyl-D-erythritol 4-phosphate cytidylyltransferase n=1 Tax=Shewanella avicenniae TaxID=2814294 RepID=A0ABX7QVB4_9GAMM|nr:2-C-methyl-D-erythritol 4-phosphate cytidylyltransferase [Shewanella avicenniae]QSX34768.1 2-C-methyl-D-erythritol 4-phosphate cytidylyltransferase [Shewanella avicenniae]
MSHSSSDSPSLAKVIAVVPAAGIGSRMQAERPKQYLPLADSCILAVTLDVLLSHPAISEVVVALNPDDTYFSALPQAKHPKLRQVIGGAERVDSVIAALQLIDTPASWALVHDAARPCLTHTDIDKLLSSRSQFPHGAILAAPVRDTMKRAGNNGCIATTVPREALWHALTPQLFPTAELLLALEQAVQAGVNVTDEASAMEWKGVSPGLVSGRVDNIKVTHPDDLPLAALYLEYHRHHH